MFGRKKRKDLANVWYTSVNESIIAGIQHRVETAAKFVNHGTTLWKLKRGLGNLYKDVKAHDRDITSLQKQIEVLFRENTRCRGFYWHKAREKYLARIMVNGVYKCLGYYDDPDEARAAYLAAKAELHPTAPILGDTSC